MKVKKYALILSRAYFKNCIFVRHSNSESIIHILLSRFPIKFSTIVHNIYVHTVPYT